MVATHAVLTLSFPWPNAAAIRGRP